MLNQLKIKLMKWNEMKSRGFVRSCEKISTCNKHAKMVTGRTGLPLMTLYKPVNMWSHEITWHIKNIASPVSQCLWSPNLSGWWHNARSSHPYILMTSKWGGLVRSRDKLNTLYPHLWKTHGHQTRLGVNLPWETPTLKAT